MTNQRELVKWAEQLTHREFIGGSLTIEPVGDDAVRVSNEQGNAVFFTENDTFDPGEKPALLVLISDQDNLALPRNFIEVLPRDTTSERMSRILRLGLELGQLRQTDRNQQENGQQSESEIQSIFDAFIRASVHAIEQRNPSTSGHSFRVASLTRALAEVINSTDKGPYAGAKFSDDDLVEIETAALLHDFGKVGVREEVIVKAKKLYPPNLKMVRARFDFIRRSIENDHLHRRLMMVEEGTPDEELAILDQACERAIRDIEDCWRIIRGANEPTVMPSGDFDKIEEIAKRSYFDLGGQRLPFLEKEEVTALQVAKGTLTSAELDEIRSHAAQSISFLKTIPWNKKLQKIPEYAGAHHEKLDGSGYPYGLKSDEIPLPAKMMAVADIYDALTAADRPYKKAVSAERALFILELEAKDNHIDHDLVKLFAENKIYQILERG